MVTVVVNLMTGQLAVVLADDGYRWYVHDAEQGDNVYWLKRLCRVC